MSTTPYMSLSLPTPSVSVGPDWATTLNAALIPVDAHNHTPGKGVLVPTAGLNVNADLPFNGYNATTLRSLRMSSQATTLALATDLDCLYVSGGNLYYNNGSGTAVQITSGAALSATSLGGISGLAATTGSVSYNSGAGTFTFWSNTNTSALMDVGAVTIRAAGASAKGVTIQAVAGLSAAYALTLPTTLPGSELPLVLSSGGALATRQIGTADIATAAVTSAKLASDVGQFLAAASYDSSGTALATSGGTVLPAATHVGTGSYTIAIAGLTTAAIVFVSIINSTGVNVVLYGPTANLLNIFTSSVSGTSRDSSFSVVVVKL